MIKNGKTKNTTNKYNMGTNLLFCDKSANNSDNFNGISRNNGFAYTAKIPKILKNRWANAATIAVTFNVRDARSAVTVVPILAPNVNG